MADENQDKLIDEYFTMFDIDGDNKIEADELKILMRVMYKQNIDDEMVERCLADYDADRSGTIELAEFKKMYNNMPIKPQGVSLKDLFSKYDKNGDGDLEASEVKQFLGEDLELQCSDDDVKRLMDEVDVDKDGRVDFREFCILYARYCTQLR